MSKISGWLEVSVSLVSMTVFMTIGGILLESASHSSPVMYVLCNAVALCALVAAIASLINSNTDLKEGELNV